MTAPVIKSSRVSVRSSSIGWRRAAGAVFRPRRSGTAKTPDLVDRWRGWGLVWGAPESVRYSVAFDPDAFVDVALDALGTSGVRLRMHTWFAGVDVVDGAIGAVLVESKKGREAILPRVVIDASGDGDVFVAAGADHEHVTIPPHLWFRRRRCRRRPTTVRVRHG